MSKLDREGNIENLLHILAMNSITYYYLLYKIIQNFTWALLSNSSTNKYYTFFYPTEKHLPHRETPATRVSLAKMQVLKKILWQKAHGYHWFQNKFIHEHPVFLQNSPFAEVTWLLYSKVFYDNLTQWLPLLDFRNWSKE